MSLRLFLISLLAFATGATISAPSLGYAAPKGDFGTCFTNKLEEDNSGSDFRSPRPDGKIYSRVRAAPSPDLKGSWVVSLSDIQKSLKHPEQIWPPVSPTAKYYFDPVMSPFNSYGAAGSFGPLSKYGPNGMNLWNPSFWFSHSGMRQTAKDFWHSFDFEKLDSLSSVGATGHVPYHEILPNLGPNGKHMQEGGILGFLGPKSAMGPDGPLGEHGGVGVHETDRNLSRGEAARLSAKGELGASFVTDEVTGPTGVDVFKIRVRKGTVPEFRVVSDSPNDRFAIELYSKDGTFLGESNSTDFATNILRMNVPSNTSVFVHVRYLGNGAGRAPGSAGRGYRLLATEPKASSRDLGFDGPYITHFR